MPGNKKPYIYFDSHLIPQVRIKKCVQKVSRIILHIKAE